MQYVEGFMIFIETMCTIRRTGIFMLKYARQFFFAVIKDHVLSDGGRCIFHKEVCSLDS